MSFFRGFGGRPEPEITWRSAGLTDVGRVRKVNEDRFLDMPRRGLWVVADGIGGHEAGDVAAQTVVDGVMHAGSPRKINDISSVVAASLAKANEEIRQLADDRGRDVVIGTTVVAAMARGAWLSCLWAGDSRLYRLRAGRLMQLTRDHDLLSEMSERDAPPELVDAARRGNVITRAVGVADKLELEELKVEVAAGDVFLLCSDGLYKEVDDRTIAAFLHESEPVRAANRLLDEALAAGARDNTTLIVMRAEIEKRGRSA